MQKQTIKIVQKFFTEKEAVNAASYQRAKAKKEKRAILKVEKIDAYELFKLNGWLKNSPFKKLGIPVRGQFLVIVKYNHNVDAVKKTCAVKKNIVAASKSKDAAKRFRIVRLNDCQKQQARAAGFNYVSNITVPVVKFRYRITHSIGVMKYTSFSFTPPTYRCQIAA